jgi:hypothetical protein
LYASGTTASSSGIATTASTTNDQIINKKSLTQRKITCGGEILS